MKNYFNDAINSQMRRLDSDNDDRILYGFERNIETDSFYNSLTPYELEYLSRALELLSNEQSRKSFAYSFLFRRRHLFPQHVARNLDQIHNMSRFSEKEFETFKKLGLSKNNSGFYDLKQIGYDIQASYGNNDPNYALAAMYVSFVLKQYEYKADNDFCGVSETDIVIDGGACYGDTALYFASQLTSGKVFSFEMSDENLRVFEDNIQQNPTLSSRISIQKYALWKESMNDLMILGDGPGARVGELSGGIQVKTLSIDDLVDRENLSRVDFIKMDIEGAEMEALLGGEKSIRKFRPKMAITLYHKDSHFWEIPLLLNEYLPDSKFFFDHFYMNEWESVLYVIPQNR